jgi:hypothetical protein
MESQGFLIMGNGVRMAVGKGREHTAVNAVLDKISHAIKASEIFYMVSKIRMLFLYQTLKIGCSAL